MKKLLTLILLLPLIQANAQQIKTENVILITLDGLRWQELFGGADSSLLRDKEYVDNVGELTALYWDNSPESRRKKLMPFFWTEIAMKGQLFGNRWNESYVNCTNGMLFSYPGYNEILTGVADDESITSNDKIPNPNVTILELANQKKRFNGKVAGFGSWDVFPYIVNEERSGVSVNAGFEKSKDLPLSEKEDFLNQLQDKAPSPWATVRFDVFTHHFAVEYVKKHEPKLLYIAYGETDDFAHDGEYDQYLKSANRTDQFIKELWEYIQITPAYKDKTTMIITTDHGRGTVPKESWKSHGNKIDGADEIWIAAIGPDTSPSGGNNKGQFFQDQVFATVAELLGINYNRPQAGKSIQQILR